MRPAFRHLRSSLATGLRFGLRSAGLIPPPATLLDGTAEHTKVLAEVPVAGCVADRTHFLLSRSEPLTPDTPRTETGCCAAGSRLASTPISVSIPDAVSWLWLPQSVRCVAGRVAKAKGLPSRWGPQAFFQLLANSGLFAYLGIGTVQ